MNNNNYSNINQANYALVSMQAYNESMNFSFSLISSLAKKFAKVFK